jgi:hypothetical protein
MPTENIFLLSNGNNYYVKLNSTLEKIKETYVNLVNFYITYSIENMNIKDHDIFFTGIKVVNNVFRLVMLYTKNLEVTIYNTQQCIYYYVEYISQITDKEDNIFFNLSIKDAVIYVYSRTIFEIKRGHVKETSKSDIETIHAFTSITKQYNILSNVCSKYLFKTDIESTKQSLTEISKLYLLRVYEDDEIMAINKMKSIDEVIDHLKSITEPVGEENA